jgi:hypothetical protein
LLRTKTALYELRTANAREIKYLWDARLPTRADSPFATVVCEPGLYNIKVVKRRKEKILKLYKGSLLIGRQNAFHPTILRDRRVEESVRFGVYSPSELPPDVLAAVRGVVTLELVRSRVVVNLQTARRAVHIHSMTGGNLLG